MKILSFGSLNYDYTYEVEHFLAPKETLAAKSMQRGFGGKGANQSIAFARAGLSVYHAGRVGADGQPFVDYLKQNGIHTDYLIKDDAAATGHAIIEVCRGENCILIYGGANQEITTEQIDHTLKAFSPGDWLVLQNEISNLPYLMQAAQKKGLSIFFNAAPYDVGILTYPMELVDVLCVNEVEACALAGTETFEADAVLTLLHEKYPQTRLLLTAGSAGSYYLDAERRLFVPCEKVQAVDTTAAGDTYSGYFLAGLCSGSSVEDAMRLATKAAGICRAAQRCSGIHPGNQRVEMNDTEGHVDILVCMAGTGGTGFGTASYLRSRNPNLQVVLVQPHPGSRLTPEHPDAQIIDGVLPAYDVPESALFDYLRPDWSDACINVRTEEAYETAHEVLRAEGLFLGTSAAAALHAAVQVGRRPENQGKNIVVIVPDNGMKYLSTPMYRQK